jgi:hypothetical protein
MAFGFPPKSPRKEWVHFHDGAPHGYSYCPELCEICDCVSNEPDAISSLDVSSLSAHQRIAMVRDGLLFSG